MSLLYNGLDTLEISSVDFSIEDVDIFHDAKEQAKETTIREAPFEYEVKDKKTGKYHSQCFIMRSSSFNPYSWSFYDINKKFLFSSAFSEKSRRFRVKILSKSFFTETLFDLLNELQEILSVFNIDVYSMKVRRLDWATDLSFNHKMMQKFIENSYFKKCVYMRYSNILRPQDVALYNVEYNSEVCCTGFVFGSKAVKLRVYDKVLEIISKYNENSEKNELYLSNYYPHKTIKFCGEDASKEDMGIDLWLEMLGMKYLKDSKQVIRFEYQFLAKILKNKFKYVSDLDYEDLTSFVYTTFHKHTGFKEEAMDDDLKLYERSIGNTKFFKNKYRKIEPSLEGRINKAVIQIGSGLSNLGLALSEKHKRVIPYHVLRCVLERYEEFFQTKNYEKMYENTKLIFSKKGVKEGILDYRALTDYLLDHSKEILK